MMGDIEEIVFEDVKGKKRFMKSPRAYKFFLNLFEKGEVTKFVVDLGDELVMAGAQENGQWIYLRSPKDYLFLYRVKGKPPEMWSLKNEPTYISKKTLLKRLKDEIERQLQEDPLGTVIIRDPKTKKRTSLRTWDCLEDWVRSLAVHLANVYGLDLRFIRFLEDYDNPYHYHVYYTISGRRSQLRDYGEFETWAPFHSSRPYPRSSDEIEKDIRKIFGDIKSELSRTESLQHMSKKAPTLREEMNCQPKSLSIQAISGSVPTGSGELTPDKPIKKGARWNKTSGLKDDGGTVDEAGTSTLGDERMPEAPPVNLEVPNNGGQPNRGSRPPFHGRHQG